MAIYDKVINEVGHFLPPGEDVTRFISRQCKSHLNVEPEAVTTANLPELARWIGISASLLIPQEKATELRQKIESIV